MITEDTVRKAVAVANELVPWPAANPDCYWLMWQAVYMALVYGGPTGACPVCDVEDGDAN